MKNEFYLLLTLWLGLGVGVPCCAKVISTDIVKRKNELNSVEERYQILRDVEEIQRDLINGLLMRLPEEIHEGVRNRLQQMDQLLPRQRLQHLRLLRQYLQYLINAQNAGLGIRQPRPPHQAAQQVVANSPIIEVGNPGTVNWDSFPPKQPENRQSWFSQLLNKSWQGIKQYWLPVGTAAALAVAGIYLYTTSSSSKAKKITASF